MVVVAHLSKFRNFPRRNVIREKEFPTRTCFANENAWQPLRTNESFVEKTHITPKAINRTEQGMILPDRRGLS
jgi:hypothetical protein